MTSIFLASILMCLEDITYSKNKFHLTKIDISSSWQKGNISEVDLELSVQPQHEAGPNL